MARSEYIKSAKADLDTIAEVLQKLSLLPAESISQELATKNAAEDFSLQISKSTQNAIKLGTGAGALASTVTVIFGYFNDASDTVIAAAMLGAAIIIAAGIFGLARVMDGDLRCRGSISTESVRVRGEVATALLNLIGEPGQKHLAVKANEETRTHLNQDQILFGLAFADRLKVVTSTGEHAVEGARWSSDEKLELKLDDGDWVHTDRISSFSAS